jgi:hypothetical protein
MAYFTIISSSSSFSCSSPKKYVAPPGLNHPWGEDQRSKFKDQERDGGRAKIKNQNSKIKRGTGEEQRAKIKGGTGEEQRAKVKIQRSRETG